MELRELRRKEREATTATAQKEETKEPQEEKNIQKAINEIREKVRLKNLVVAEKSPVSSKPSMREGGYSLSVHGKAVEGNRVQIEVTTNIPGIIEVMVALSLAGQKPDDTYIGKDARITVKEGKGQVSLDASALPSGKYEVEASFYPRWGFKDARSKKAKITETLEAKEAINLSGSGKFPAEKLTKLYLRTEPAGARIRILNIRPKFHQGITLKPGKYHIEISFPGYHTIKKWIFLDGDNVDRTIDIKLINTDSTKTACLTCYEKMVVAMEDAASAANLNDYCTAADHIEAALNWLGTCEGECAYNQPVREKLSAYKTNLIKAMTIYVKKCGH